MPTFICSVCGQEHTGLVMDLAYQRLADMFKIPANERPKRIRITDDLCIIDDAEFYIRGVLALSVPEVGDQFRWGFGRRSTRKRLTSIVLTGMALPLMISRLSLACYLAVLRCIRTATNSRWQSTCNPITSAHYWWF